MEKRLDAVLKYGPAYLGVLASAVAQPYSTMKLRSSLKTAVKEALVFLLLSSAVAGLVMYLGSRGTTMKGYSLVLFLSLVVFQSLIFAAPTTLSLNLFGAKVPFAKVFSALCYPIGVALIVVSFTVLIVGSVLFVVDPPMVNFLFPTIKGCFDAVEQLPASLVNAGRAMGAIAIALELYFGIALIRFIWGIAAGPAWRKVAALLLIGVLNILVLAFVILITFQISPQLAECETPPVF